MFCANCHKWITKKEREFIEMQWLKNIQSQRIGRVVLNKVPIPGRMQDIFGNSKGTIVHYCQECLKQKLMDYIFEEEKPKLRLIAGGLK